MLSNQIICQSGNILDQNQNLVGGDYYIKFLNIKRNMKIAFENYEFNAIYPNKLLLSLSPDDIEIKDINCYKKIYYKGGLLNFISEYNAFYPENFYILWEILNRFNDILDRSNRILFIDDGHSSNLGHIEATIKYCETNFKYENNEYIRISLNEEIMTPIYKKFSAIYSNHRVLIFPNNDMENINKYFENREFDFVVGISENFLHNLLGVYNSRVDSNAILYINNIMNNEYDHAISVLTSMYKEVKLYKPEIGDQFDHSCWILLFHLEKPELKAELQNNKNIMTNLNSIRNIYHGIYIDKLLELYHKKPNDNIMDLDRAIEWARNNNLVIKENNKNILYEPTWTEYIKYSLMNYDKTNKGYIDLHYIKRKLNNYKRIIDTKEQYVENDLENNIIDWNKLTDCIDMNRNLKKIITWKYNAEMVNNAWIKLYELLSHENIFKKDITKFKSFHIFDTTGTFVLALNHYIKTEIPNITEFQWYSQCPYYKKNFVGRYRNFSELFPENWIFNGYGDDILDYRTIKYYMKDKRLQNLDLITCDGSLKLPIDKFNEQEGYISQLTFAQIFLALHLLPKGKILICKMFLPLIETITISLLYLFTNLFKDVIISKPMTSHTSSSEVYCICKDYCGFNNIDKDIRNRLLLIFNNYNVTCDIIPKDEMYSAFFKELEYISNKLADRQILSIKKSLYLRHTYFFDYDVQKELSDLKEEFIEKWIEDNHIKPLTMSNNFVSFRSIH